MNRQQARPASRPLVQHRTWKFTEDDALRLTLREQVKLLAGYLAVGAVTLAIVLFLSLPGK